MRSLPKPSRANPARPPIQSTLFTNRLSPQGAHRHASRDPFKSPPPLRRTHPQPACSVEFASCRSPRHAWLPVTRILENQAGIEAACDSLSRATGFAALPSPARTRRCRPRFTLIYQRDRRALHTPRSESSIHQTTICQTTLVPFSDTKQLKRLCVSASLRRKESGHAAGPSPTPVCGYGHAQLRLPAR